MKRQPLTLEDYQSVKNGHPLVAYCQDFVSQNNGGVRDKRLDLIGDKVETEHGIGEIIGVELFPNTYNIEERYVVKITDNNGKEILKSMFPDNELYYWKKDLKFL